MSAGEIKGGMMEAQEFIDYHERANESSIIIRHPQYRLADCGACGSCFTVEHEFLPWRETNVFKPRDNSGYNFRCNNCGKGYHAKP